MFLVQEKENLTSDVFIYFTVYEIFECWVENPAKYPVSGLHWISVSVPVSGLHWISGWISGILKNHFSCTPNLQILKKYGENYLIPSFIVIIFLLLLQYTWAIS
jgi:hypothetical protein